MVGVPAVAIATTSLACPTWVQCILPKETDGLPSSLTPFSAVARRAVTRRMVNQSPHRLAVCGLTLICWTAALPGVANCELAGPILMYGVTLMRLVPLARHMVYWTAPRKMLWVRVGSDALARTTKVSVSRSTAPTLLLLS